MIVGYLIFLRAVFRFGLSLYDPIMRIHMCIGYWAEFEKRSLAADEDGKYDSPAAEAVLRRLSADACIYERAVEWGYPLLRLSALREDRPMVSRWLEVCRLRQRHVWQTGSQWVRVVDCVIFLYIYFLEYDVFKISSSSSSWANAWLISQTFLLMDRYSKLV